MSGAVVTGASHGARMRVVRGLAGVVVLFALIEGFTRLELVSPQYLPYATTVLERMGNQLGDGAFLSDVLSTLVTTVLGLALAIAIAVPLGIALGSSERAYRMSSGVIEFLRPVPAVAFIPLAILVWGQGLEMKLILVTFAAQWPILFNTIYGTHGVDPVAKATARSFGFGRLAVLMRVSLPSTLPFISVGIRISAPIALVVAVAVELIASTDTGIGAYMIRVGSRGTHADYVYAAVVYAGLLGLLLNRLLDAGERRFLGWPSA